MEPVTVLKNIFGYPAFRPGQEALVEGILQGRDVLGVLPTGSGKSICYQLPALMLPGVTLVVSPLIALMRDQVAALVARGIHAAYVNTSLTPAQVDTVYRRIRQGAYKIIYVAPERLESERFIEVMQAQQVSLLAVDEAHCISEWGQNFRPSYRKIPAFVRRLPQRPVVAAFTATATAQVQEDTIRLLGLEDPLQLVTGYDRPNLYFGVLTPQNRPRTLLRLVEDRRGSSGIIYCSTRKNVQQVWESLNTHGFSAARYHAGLPPEVRQESQEAFQSGEARIMVATNAFGMGIDKADVRYVIHYNMPMSLEAYYQEAGRAGRDGAPAECILLFMEGDVSTARFLLEEQEEDPELTAQEQKLRRRMDARRLNAMIRYCRGTACLRQVLLNYFGQSLPHECGNCSCCHTRYDQKDITTQAQMILSCVKRLEGALGENPKEELLLRTLRGDKKLRDQPPGALSTFGLMKEVPEKTLRGYLDSLALQGYTEVSPQEQVSLTGRARLVLFQEQEVTMAVPKAPPKKLPLRRREKREKSKKPPQDWQWWLKKED